MVIIVTSEKFAEMSKRRFTTSSQEESLLGYVERIKSLMLMSGEEKNLTMAVFGTSFCGRRKDTILDAVLDLQMDAKVQVRMVDSAADMARLLLCMHRAVANAEHRKRRIEQSNFVMDQDRRCIKGVRPVGRADAELTSDWWGKMLMRIPRVTEQDMQTVVAAYPCPFRLMLEYEKIERQDVRERLLANLQVGRGAGRTETQRRLGPVLSKKICLMLTSTDGEQLVTT
uniref:Uncharacterized protein n=1 Tax=Plectus sambesii TaxID=2011161 RepID=A0A914UIA3_9BILA